MTSLLSNSDENSDFLKCGEIIIKRNGEKVYTFHCVFCEIIKTNLHSFIEHIEDAHNDEITEIDKFVEIEISEEIDGDDKNDYHILYNNEENDKLQAEVILTDSGDSAQSEDIKLKDVELISIDDPLNEEFSNDEQAYDDNDNEDLMEILDDNETGVEFQDIVENQVESDPLLDDTTVVLFIIEIFQTHSILWENSTRNRHERQAALDDITKKVNQKFNMKLNTKKMHDYLASMRSKYRVEVKRIECAEAEGRTHVPIWLYDKLSFLKDALMENKHKLRGWKSLLERSALPLARLTNAQNIKFIKIYENFSCLWSEKHLENRFREKRIEALDMIRERVAKEMKMNWTKADIQFKIQRIRYACTQEKYRQLQCTKTKQAFKPECAFYNNIKFLIDDVPPFQCDLCDEIFNTIDQHNVHRAKHDGTMPFKCPLCDRGFMLVTNRTVHLRRHTRECPFECEYCGKRYATSTDRKVHMRCHTGERPYFCEICGKSYTTWAFFDVHKRKHENRPSHICTVCSKAFYRKSKLSEHMKIHLNIRDKICMICGKAFISTKYLRQHKQIHAEKKKYSCKICGKEFAQCAGLSGHMKSHGTTLNGNPNADLTDK